MVDPFSHTEVMDIFMQTLLKISCLQAIIERTQNVTRFHASLSQNHVRVRTYHVDVNVTLLCFKRTSSLLSVHARYVP